ncbi:protein LNK1 isoform X3 [Punica granatum]|uniref:Protein LNK1 isoform X3 n=1 Tax=Punica granatum TaxID=22663 RepID=A0A6P8DBX6_PUNGR|nr:protein LNK1 isoform X3 [Punica granatum]
MSDLCIYELQDNVWDEFGESDDHIVPQPADETGKCAVQTDSHKKLRVEVSGISNDVDHSTNFVVLGKREESSLTSAKRNKMLEKGSWSRAADDGFPASCDGDSVKETASMTSDDSRMSNHCFKSGSTGELCARDAVLVEGSAAVDDNLYHYPLNHISQTESSLNFFNDEDKEGNDLYYEWPDIGNFEDVDKMFSTSCRNCDSTFGIGSLSNDDDLGWFSPSHAIEGSEDALKSGFKFSCPESTELRSVSENHRDSGPDSGDLSVNDSQARNATQSCNMSSQITCAHETASFDHLQFVNGLDMKSESKEDSMPTEEMNPHRKHSKLQHQSEGKWKDGCLGNGDSFQHYDLSEQTTEAKIPFGDQAHQMHSYTAAGYHQPVGQISDYTTLSSIKCENNGQPSPSPKESSYASNQVQSPHGSSFEAPTAKNDKRVNLHSHQNFPADNLNHLDGTSPTAISDPVAVLKRVHQTENDIDGHSEVDGISIGVTKELDPSFAQDNSCVSSMLDEISLEATSFRQLQQVTEQLDIRTKLCIRDSLYRLARSAEQRHHYGNPNGGNRSDGARSGALIVNESNKCNGFMDMETDTNPIDRSVAHLLFHRPSDPSLVPGSDDALSPKSHATILRSVSSTPPTVNEKENRGDETATDPDKMTS